MKNIWLVACHLSAPKSKENKVILPLILLLSLVVFEEVGSTFQLAASFAHCPAGLLNWEAICCSLVVVLFLASSAKSGEYIGQVTCWADISRHKRINGEGAGRSSVDAVVLSRRRTRREQWEDQDRGLYLLDPLLMGFNSIWFNETRGMMTLRNLARDSLHLE